MRILVTGGAGFIGSAAAERLAAEGHAVVVLDDLSSGRRENLAGVDAELVVGDVRDRDAVAAVMRGCETAIHLAAFVSVPGSIEDPVGSAATNVVGTATVLDACRRAGVRRVLFASSAAVYGDAVRVPTSEEELARPGSPYGAQKLAGEHLCRVAATMGSLDAVSFRFFNVYGPRQAPDSDYAAVVPAFLDRCARGLAPRIHGDGEQTRDFVLVDDVVEGLVRALADPAPFAGEVYNLARGEGITIAALAEAIRALAGGAPPAEHGPPRAGDIAHSVADVRKLRARFGWSPVTTPAEGLERAFGGIASGEVSVER